MNVTNPIGYTDLLDGAEDRPLQALLQTLSGQIASALDPSRHGDLPRWLATLARLPEINPSSVDLSADCLRAGVEADIDAPTRGEIIRLLQAFHPWRKGPFCIFGIYIDTEWRSDMKWARLADALSPLNGRTVLDVGSGNGYYGWRMLGAGARQVVGIDPTLRYVMQHWAVRHFIGAKPNHVLPLALEDLPQGSEAFDTVFSMGVLYHRRDHMEHLRRLFGHLRSGGEVVIEGLVTEGGRGDVLIPKGRYAKMHNVRAVPSCLTLEGWLAEAGYRNIRLVDLTATTGLEQRRTAWMTFESLSDFLDPADPTHTIEGHPAPLRAVMIAEKP